MTYGSLAEKFHEKRSCLLLFSATYTVKYVKIFG